MYHKRVKPMTGRNPIARAIAHQALKSSMLNLKVKLYLTQDGEPCADFCAVIGMTLSMVVYASQLDPKIKPDNLALRIVRGGLSACSQMADADRFNRNNLPAVERGIDSAVELNRVLDPSAVNQAWAALQLNGFKL